MSVTHRYRAGERVEVIRTLGLVRLGCVPRFLGGLSSEGRDLVAQRRVGCEDAVIAMSVHPGRRHQCGDSVDQFQRAERQLGGAVDLWLGQVIAEMLVINGLETLERQSEDDRNI